MDDLYGALQQIAAEDYHKDRHEPPSDGPPLNDLLDGSVFPQDVYTHPEYYAFGDYGAESIRIVRQVRGKPDAMVTIYRSVSPAHHAQTINTGDWVAISKGYAQLHGEDRGWDEWVEPKDKSNVGDDEGWIRHEGNWNLLEATVPARTIRNGGNDLVEWGYFGPPISARVSKKTASGILKDYWTWPNGKDGEPRWDQPYGELIQDALSGWKGSNSVFNIHMDDAEHGAPIPNSGTGKIFRAQAEAILNELKHNAKPVPRLYRGDNRQPSGIRGWSSNRRTANGFARLGGGQVWVLAKGSCQGICIADYKTGSGRDQDEQEWIVNVSSGVAQVLSSVTAAMWPDRIEDDKGFVVVDAMTGKGIGWYASMEEAQAAKTEAGVANVYRSDEYRQGWVGRHFGAAKDSWRVYTQHGVERVTRTADFPDFDSALAYGQSISPDIDDSMVPNVDESFGNHPGYEKGLFWFGNRYAVIIHEPSGKTAATNSIEAMVDRYLSSIPSGDAALLRARRPTVVEGATGGPSFAWFDPEANTVNFSDSGPVSFDLVCHEMTHALDWAAGRISGTSAYAKGLVPRGFGKNWGGPRGDAHSVAAEVFVDAYMAAHFPGKEGVQFDRLRESDPQRYAGLMEIARNVATAASTLRSTGARMTVTLYHGTSAKHLDEIRANGLHAPDGVVGSPTWFMLTDSFGQAAEYSHGMSGGLGAPIVIEYAIPVNRIWAHGVKPGDLLWPGWPHDVYGFNAMAYAVKSPVPGSLITAVHQVGKTAASRQDVGINMSKYFFYGTTDAGQEQILQDGEIRDDGHVDVIISTRFEDMHDSPVVISMALPYTWLWDHLDPAVREIFSDRQSFFNVIGGYSGELTVVAPIPANYIKRGPRSKVKASLTIPNLDVERPAFLTIQKGQSLSGWKVHIYCESTDDVQMAMARLKWVLDDDLGGDPAMACKVATQGFFDLVKEPRYAHQLGKGVTLYLPKVATVQDDLDWIVRNMEGWPRRGVIEGDIDCGNGVWKRYELSEQIEQEIDIATEMHRYHNLYVKAVGVGLTMY